MEGDLSPHWLRTPLGSALLESETRAVTEALANVFGFHLLQIGAWGLPGQFTEAARTRYKAVFDLRAGAGIGARCHPARLPVAADSVDAVLLPHTLEMDPEPHTVLREVSRVLIGEGHLVILGFNPWSAWGLRRLATRGAFPRGALQLIPERRLRDWLTLLGLEVCATHRCAYMPPINRESVLSRLGDSDSWGARHLSGFAGAYILVAQKRVYSVTPLRPQWARRPRRVTAGLAEPTTRSAA